jgi:hypothetical protein
MSFFRFGLLFGLGLGFLLITIGAQQPQQGPPGWFLTAPVHTTTTER